MATLETLKKGAEVPTTAKEDKQLEEKAEEKAQLEK